MRRQWYDIEKLKKFQEKNFIKIFQHAYNNSTFYRKKFKEVNINLNDIKRLDDLRKLPFTTKEEIIKNFPDNMITNEFKMRRLHYKKTSGSSGLQMTLVSDQRCEDYYDCIYGRALFAIGYIPWQSMAYFWAQPRDYFWYPTYHKKKIYDYFGLMRKHWMDSTLSPEEQMKVLTKMRPKIIYCFPTTLVAISKIIGKNREKYKDIQPKFIISHGETLFKESRKYIESVFNCPVYNEYGTTEFVRMGWECKEKQGLHLDIDSIIVEIVKDGKICSPGEMGELVITGLHNYAMPLIRYRIGDVGMISDKPCKCGRGLPLLKTIEGRNEDFLILPSGRMLSPRNIGPPIEKFSQVTEFKFVQETKDRMILYLVDNPYITSIVISNIVKELYRVIGEYVDIKVQIVKQLDKTERGKMQAIVSKVKFNS